MKIIDFLNDMVMLFEVKFGEPSEYYDNQQLVSTILLNMRNDINDLNKHVSNEHLVRHDERKKGKSDESA